MIQGLEKAAGVASTLGRALRAVGRGAATTGKVMFAPWSFAPKRLQGPAKAVGTAALVAAVADAGDFGVNVYNTYKDPAGQLLPEYAPDAIRERLNKVMKPMIRDWAVPPPVAEEAKRDIAKVKEKVDLPSFDKTINEIYKLKGPLIARAALANAIQRSQTKNPFSAKVYDVLRSLTPFGAGITASKHYLAKDPPEIARIKQLAEQAQGQLYEKLVGTAKPAVNGLVTHRSRTSLGGVDQPELAEERGLLDDRQE